MPRKKRVLTDLEANYMLYIMQNGNTDQYKIGRTNNINRRYSQLQTGCPNELKLIKVWTHYHKTAIDRYERVLHRYYANVRIRQNGEWFTLPKEQVNRLCQPNGMQEQNDLIDNMLKEKRN